MKQAMSKIRTLLIVSVCLGLTGCDDPQVYGSIGVSSYSGGGGYYGGNPYGNPYGSNTRVSGSVMIGGRIR